MTYWNRWQVEKRGQGLTHLWLVCESTKHSVAFPHGYNIASVYCFNRDLEDFAYSHVKSWSVVDYLERIVSGGITCPRCAEAFKAYKNWLLRGGKTRMKTLDELIRERSKDNWGTSPLALMRGRK